MPNKGKYWHKIAKEAELANLELPNQISANWSVNIANQGIGAARSIRKGQISTMKNLNWGELAKSPNKGKLANSNGQTRVNWHS